MAVRLQSVSARLAEVERELDVLKAARGIAQPKSRQDFSTAKE
jgi:hypothetical protein